MRVAPAPFRLAALRRHPACALRRLLPARTRLVPRALLSVSPLAPNLPAAPLPRPTAGELRRVAAATSLPRRCRVAVESLPRHRRATATSLTRAPLQVFRTADAGLQRALEECRTGLPSPASVELLAGGGGRVRAALDAEASGAVPAGQSDHTCSHSDRYEDIARVANAHDENNARIVLTNLK